MISRGYFIGQIVDTLSIIAERVETRCKLGLTDLNLHLENFYKDLLSILYEANFKNLNEDHKNSPGLDVGDALARIAFQITSEKTSEKINSTLLAIDDEQLNKYDDLYVLMVRRKQGSYTGLKDELLEKCEFSVENILDYEDICSKLMYSSLPKLELIYDLCKKESRAVLVELEIPDEDANFPTNARDLSEKIPKPRLGECEKFLKYISTEHGIAEYELAEIKNTISEISKHLSRLPRITRDCYSVMLERREKGTKFRGDDFIHINADKLERYFRGYDIMGEVRILKSDNYITFHEPEYEGAESGVFSLDLVGAVDEWILFYIVGYCEKEGIPFQRPIVALDFGDF